MTLLDLRQAARLYHGGVDLRSVHAHWVEIWRKPEAVPIAFPDAIFDVHGLCYDPYSEGIRQTASSSGDDTGALTGVGGPVGIIPYRGVANAGPAGLWTGTAARRPTLAEVSGRRCLAFDGVDDRLDTIVVVELGTPGPFLTMFAMVHVDGSTAGIPLTLSRAAASSSWFEPIYIDADTDELAAKVRLGAPYFVDTGYASSASAGWRLVWPEYAFSAFATDGGTFRVEVDDVEVLDLTVTPARSATTDIDRMVRLQIGARRNGGSSAQFYNAELGRFGYITRALDAGEKATMKQWLRGLALVE